MTNKLIVFDFDGTLFNTVTESEGKRIWEEKTGTVWPYNGWWGHAETLNPDIFYSPLNQWVFNEYKKAKSDPKAYVILATGRLSKKPGMKENIQKLLDENGIIFDDVFLNWGGDTFIFKTKLFTQLMSKLKVKDLTMFDDRHEHLIKFKEWANDQPFNTKIVDVTDKSVTTIKNF